MYNEYVVTSGDRVITRTGAFADIEKVLYQEVYTDYADIEFIDSMGNYRHYKSSFDGGQVVINNAYDLLGFPCSVTVLKYN